MFMAPQPTADPWLRADAGRGRCAVAAHALKAGAVVGRFSGQPYAACPLPSQSESLCAKCLRNPGGGAKQLARCSKCKWARYCGSVCQRADWSAHKHECAALAKGKLRGLADAPAADLLLVGRCLWRRHDATLAADKAESSADVSSDDACYDALEPAEPSESDLALGALAASLPGLLPPCASAEASAQAAAKLIGAFGRNNFGVLNDVLSVVGAGCYPPAALLNHSCAPNCVLAFDGSTLEIRTLTAVGEGEELTHSYVDLCLPTGERRALLSSRYGFACTCERCETGLRTANGENVDVLLQGRVDEKSATGHYGSELAAALNQSAALLVAAAHEEDGDKELDLLRKALSMRRSSCHPLSAALYEAECQALTASLALGQLEEARSSCHAAVAFLAMALSHVPHHPLLALQRFTLSDLELACADQAAAPYVGGDTCVACVAGDGGTGTGDGGRAAQQASRAAALAIMRECAAAIEVSSATRSTLREQAQARLVDLAALASGPEGVAAKNKMEVLC